MELNGFPNIVTMFDKAGNCVNRQNYCSIIKHSLIEILPEKFQKISNSHPDHLDDQRTAFKEALPFIRYKSDSMEKSYAFYMLWKSSAHSFKFLLDMLTYWLVPGQKLNILSCYTVDFQLPELSPEVLTVSEIIIQVSNEKEREEIKKNIPIIESEIRLGLKSSIYARRILEVKGVSTDTKTGLIQENIANLISRFPSLYDQDLLTEMQHLLVICQDKFRAQRSSRQIVRIITIHYLFRKKLRKAVFSIPDKRHLHLKILRVPLQTGRRPALGIYVGINFLMDKEIFEERHLLAAVQNYVPGTKAVEGSFFSNRMGQENICTLYLEIEKSNGEEFKPEEIQVLHQELPTDLKDRIEHLMHPIFMPRNEEEIMRNILTLSSQIKYLHDLPQVIITFDKQTHNELFFTIILVRVLLPDSLPIQTLFTKSKTFLGYIHDRSRGVGFLRKKYSKEATVFGVTLKKNQFLRRDNSIDLNRARQVVINELTRIVGEVRDFNGGMISKQHEVLCHLRENLGTEIKYNDLLLENFFYSLTPDVMRTVLDAQVLKKLFLLLIDSIDQNFFSGKSSELKMQKDDNQVYVIIKAEERGLKEVITKGLNTLSYETAKLASVYVTVYDIPYLGYLYINNNVHDQEVFCQNIQDSLTTWSLRKRTSTQLLLQFS